MAKVKIQDHDETPGNNTDLNSISIAEGMAPSDVNNAIRELMAQLRKYNLYRGHISGLIPSSGGDADHDISFSVGEASDSTNVQMIYIDTALVKQIDANWAAGTGNGGFPSGLTLSADTWYHLFVIGQTDGTSDAGFDTSLTAANLLTDATGYTLYRRVGSLLTDSSSNIIGFTALENAGGALHVQWADPPGDVNDSTLTTTSKDYTLTTPTGVRTVAKLQGFAFSGSGNQYVYVRSKDVNDEAPSTNTSPFITATAFASANHPGGSIQMDIVTNTSSQIAARATATITLNLSTLGWVDHRR